MKFGRFILQVNAHRVTQLDFLIGCRNFKIAALMSFYAEKCPQLVSVHEAYA